jgi:RNA polymerase sigma-70 factor (ECF subfamily)
MTEGAIKGAVHRLRKRYRELIRVEIAGTLALPQDIDKEMRHLFYTLAQK